jgi:DNA-directed RNA polymerase specialized sigma24 family protein
MSPIWQDLVWLQSALRDMTEHERTAFVMSELEGRSRSEIATTFLISTDEVDSRIQSAYERLERGICLDGIPGESRAEGRLVGN